jgi:WS/DGAT/MGAT family acyltransferase
MAGRLAPLDAAFLDLEGPKAHMHVGFAATLRPTAPGAGTYDALRDHIAGRLGRARRYRQRLATPPFGMGDPVWIDDASFDVDRHVMHARGDDLGQVVEQVMSVPLERDRPLWEMWIADGLPGGEVGLVGKLHHSMVDGAAAVELFSLLLDTEASPAPDARGDTLPEAWRPDPTPGVLQAAASTLAQAGRDAVDVALLPARLARDPGRLLALPGATVRAGRTVAGALLPTPASALLNPQSSAMRHLAVVRRPLDDLRAVKRAHGTTINDVVLAACATALGRFAEEHGEQAAPLRAMVPVNVRTDDEAGAFGNRISFLFLDLPCDAPDATQALAAVHRTTVERKERGEAGHTQAVITLLGQVPRGVRRLAGKLLASPHTANLVVSNIPGPPVTTYLAGCELAEAFPIVPLTADHALSIGMLTVGGQACFGMYADRKALPDVDALAGHLHTALDDLLATT